MGNWFHLLLPHCRLRLAFIALCCWTAIAAGAIAILLCTFLQFLLSLSALYRLQQNLCPDNIAVPNAVHHARTVITTTKL